MCDEGALIRGTGMGYLTRRVIPVIIDIVPNCAPNPLQENQNPDGITDEFDDLKDAETSALNWVSRVRQPATRPTEGHGLPE
jgi:hypothetical protein